MLGAYVMKYLGRDFDIVGVGRDIIDASKVNEEILDTKFRDMGIQKGDVVINCVGAIKPRVDELGDLNAILVNSVFPRILANVASKYESHLIHPTTDCVYSGAKGKYSEEDKYDVSDMYGMSKALGEAPNCTIIRTSIIGEEVTQKRSLIEWIKSSANTTVFGFTNHLWNGMTCLEFAKICKQIIDTNNFWNGTRHLHSNTLNKKELVELVSKIYELNVTVTPKEAPTFCDRTLSTIYPDILASFNIPTIEEQIKEMKDFSNVLYS